MGRNSILPYRIQKMKSNTNFTEKNPLPTIIRNFLTVPHSFTCAKYNVHKLPSYKVQLKKKKEKKNHHSC